MDDRDVAADAAVTLSLAAVDLLAEHLGIGCHVFPFVVPSVGDTVDERVRLTTAVFDDLRARRLLRRDQLGPEVSGGLRLLARAEVVITVNGVRGDEQVQARVCGSARSAVLVQQVPQGLRFTPVRPTALARAAVGLLPRLGPGPGQSVTVAEQPQPTGTDEAAFVRQNQAARGGDAALRGVAAAILQRPRESTGNFQVSGRDQLGRELRVGDVSWFDTDAGRYLARRSRGGDGRNHVTWSPADRTRLEHTLDDLLRELPEPRR